MERVLTTTTPNRSLNHGDLKSFDALENEK